MSRQRRIDRVEQLLIAELGGDVDRAAVEVQLSNGVAGDRRRVADAGVILPVRPAETARSRAGPSPRASTIRAASSR